MLIGSCYSESIGTEATAHSIDENSMYRDTSFALQMTE